MQKDLLSLAEQLHELTDLEAARLDKILKKDYQSGYTPHTSLTERDTKELELLSALSNCHNLLHELGYGNGQVAKEALRLINKHKKTKAEDH